MIIYLCSFLSFVPKLSIFYQMEYICCQYVLVHSVLRQIQSLVAVQSPIRVIFLTIRWRYLDRLINKLSLNTRPCCIYTNPPLWTQITYNNLTTHSLLLIVLVTWLHWLRPFLASTVYIFFLFTKTFGYIKSLEFLQQILNIHNIVALVKEFNNPS